MVSDWKNLGFVIQKEIDEMPVFVDVQREKLSVTESQVTAKVEGLES